MLSLCQNIEKNSKLRQLYHKKVCQLAKWYTDAVSSYECLLKTELGMSQMTRELQESTTDKNILEDLTEDLSFSFNAKLSYFCISDALVKLILSKYSFGPTVQFLRDHELTMRAEFSDPSAQSWLNCKADVYVMAEVAAKVLRDVEKSFQIDFQALAADRATRSGLAHSSTSAVCLSAMRCYKVIRSMLVFLDSDYNDTLPTFSLDRMFNYDKFLADPCYFNFDDSTTILIADSVHDVQSDYRSAVANLRWDLVIDLDGYSDAGGLLETVSHNCLQNELLCLTSANALEQLPVGKTLWYRCGEYLSFSFEPSNTFEIVPYVYFHKDKVGRNQINMVTILKKLLLKAKAQDRTINIVAVTDNYFWIKQLIAAVNSQGVELDDYFISWVGLTNKEELIADWYDDDTAEMNSHFRHHQCPTYQFYQAFAEHRSSWNPRVSLASNFTLPGSDGPVALREIERNNLENYFDVLYDHCEQETDERTEMLRDNFYRGNVASWNTIANEYALRLRKSGDFDRAKQTIRTALGVTQQVSQKRLFFILHTAGIGGSTIARQLAWDLHEEYAVLCVRKYASNTIKARVEHLYDAVLNKAPIIILAEDTLPSFRNLCDDICRLERRCILIAACRQNSAVCKDYPQAYSEPFTSLHDSSIELLRNRYRTVSPLPKTILDKKDKAFNTLMTGQMLTPFIIGLYYFEEDFSIDAYVTKALDGCFERRYADMLACLAICDRYNCKNIPVSFVRKALNLPPRMEFLRIVPAAASLVCSERQESNIDCYHFKHPLLGSRFLDLYCEKYYGGTTNLQNALYERILWLIDNTAAMGSYLQEIHLDILICILIQNKKVDSVNQYLSALMLDIAMQENQRILMQRLAEQFKPLADGILNGIETGGDLICDRKDRQVLRLVSHAYAHLGRMYSRIAGNYEMAQKMFDLAIHYMPDQDPNIYHMAGSALLDNLKNTWDMHQNGPLSLELSDTIMCDVDRACEYFDSASEYGSPDYGYPSKLELLYYYLRFLFRTLHIRNEGDLSKLNSRQRSFQAEFLDVLEEAKTYPDFDETAKNRIADFESRFQSQIMFGNFSKAIEYYQNLVDKLSGTADIAGLGDALRGLVFARINSARATYPNAPFYRKIHNPNNLIENITTLLDQPFEPDRYSSYTTRTQLFHFWMQLAKVLNYSIDKGLSMARRWLELEERNKQNMNPEPFYYMKTLLYLSVYAGSSRAMEELHTLDSKIGWLDANGLFDARRGNRAKIRDLFVSGREMGQLLDVQHCRTDEDMLSCAADAGCRPVTVDAHFTEVLYTNAVMQIYSPISWNNENVRMDIGKTSQSAFTKSQISHKLRFLMGFSVSHLVALSHYTVDVSLSESIDVSALIEKAKNQKTKLDTNANNSRKSTAKANQSRRYKRKTRK